MHLAEQPFHCGRYYIRAWRKIKWTIEEPKSPGELQIRPIRAGTVPGIHTIKYDSEVDYIEITHSAYNRKGLAFGAVMAAEFSAGHKGIYSMADI